MNVDPKVRSGHLDRAAYVYVRQSSPGQVERHQESGRRQYARVEWAVETGWPRDQVVVVDEDQGQSGVLPSSRTGFARLMAAVGRGEVGVVVSLESARLARNGPDWAQLIFLCRWTDTLLADEHQVYDVTSNVDRMVLGIRGQIDQIERDNSVHRMVEARWNKARRGELLTIPPAGYEIDDAGELVQSSDEAVAEAIRKVFVKFDELGSGRQVWLWWRDEGLKYPVRRPDLRSHPVEWKDPTYQRVMATLRNPTYTGAYVFGRTETVRELDPKDPGRLRVRRKAREEWPVVIQGHHFAYISWEQFVSNRDRFRSNQQSHGGGVGRGPAREGSGLLQGLVRCGSCSRRMYMSYGGNAGTAKGRTPQYRCCLARLRYGGTDCQLVGSRRIDAAVVGAFLDAVQPASLAIALRAEERARQQGEDVARAWGLQIEQAEYEAERARRQYDAVEPENRLVARTLERRWNERLTQAQDLRAQATAAREQHSPCTEEERHRLAALAADIETIWDAPTTTDRDRKRLLRCLIDEVQIRTENERYDLRIIWKGGAVTERAVRRFPKGGGHATSEDTIELVRKLAVEFDDTQIARILNKQGRRTGQGNAFTKVRVTSLRGSHKIPAPAKPTPTDPIEGPFTADEAADQLGVCGSTVHRWLRDGLLPGKQMTPGAPWRIRLTEEVRQRLRSGEAPASWVGLAEAARWLGVSTSQAAYWVKTGKLPAVRTTIGKRRCWRIDVSSTTLGRQADMFEQMSNDKT
ncbi:MAG: recombinase family protein [bacterium]|nr:recombinase family protein [bacterium]